MWTRPSLIILYKWDNFCKLDYPGIREEISVIVHFSSWTPPGSSMYLYVNSILRLSDLYRDLCTIFFTFGIVR